jgi:cobalt-zinc-cadmium efflux system outer membrane protein
MPRGLGRLILLSILFTPVIATANGDSPVDLNALIEAALEVNPQVHAARAQWYAAIHSIKQNYAPADPVFGYANIDSPTNGFSQASVHSLTVNEAFQFPGKALLQADQSKLAAQSARLVYEASLRDVRAAVATAFYQALLDEELAVAQEETVAELTRVMQVTQVAYSASRASQTDFISTEFDLAAARQNAQQLRIAELNDKTTLNQLLARPPDNPLVLERKLEFKPLEFPLDKLIGLASARRQEIIEAALAARNSKIGTTLARLEYAPDYTLAYTFDNYLLSSAAPSPNRLQDHGFAITFNLPVFFWLKQREDQQRAQFTLEAARSNLDLIRNQTAAAVTILYRNAQLAVQTATLYRDSLIPLARQDYSVALIAYQLGKIDFVTLATTLRHQEDARIAYLQAANQFLASKIALEQASGVSLP